LTNNKKGDIVKKTYGNLIDFMEMGMFDVMVHGCNCFHKMGAGIAKEIKQRYPQAYHTDTMYTKRADKKKLGTYSSVSVISKKNKDVSFYIVNGYTQFEYGKGVHIDYIALEKVFEKIKNDFYGLRIAYPKIGAGLAGGDWKKISKIIDEKLENCDHTLVLLN